MGSFFDKVKDLAGGAYANLPETEFLTVGHIRATILLDALMSVEYTSPVPMWKQRLRTLNIANVHYDHLAQTMRITDMPKRLLKAPTLRSMRENWTALEESYPGIKVGAKPPGVFSAIGDDFVGGGHGGDGQRSRCNVCHIVSHVTLHNGYFIVLTDLTARIHTQQPHGWQKERSSSSDALQANYLRRHDYMCQV
jgi:hypothetical protein